MEAIYNKGLSKAIGVSNYQIQHLEYLLKKAQVAPAVNQIECYPYISQKKLITYCKEKNIHPEV